MKNRTVWTKVFAVLLIVAFLSSCAAPATAPAAEPTKAAVTAQPTAAKPVTISWRTRPSNNDEQAVYQAISDDIAKKLPSNITLKYDPAPVAGYEDKLLTELSSGTAPDIIWIPGATLSTYGQKNVLVDLMPLINADKDVKVADFYPVVMNEIMYKGALYGLPRDISTMVIYYNEDMFKNAGLKTPKELVADGKWTWEAMYDAALKLTKKTTDAKEVTWGMSINFWWATYLGFIEQAGGSLFNKDRTACGLNVPGTTQALEFMKKIYKGDGTNPAVAPAPGSDTDAASMFLSGKIGMHFDGRWSTPAVRAMAKTFKWDVAELPTGPAGKSNFVFWGAYVITKNTKDVNAAWQVLKELTSSDTQSRIAKLGTNIPSRSAKSAMDVFMAATPPENNQAFVNAIAYAKPEQSPWNVNMTQVLGQILQPEAVRVINGEVTPADFTKNICGMIDPLIKK